MVDLPVPLLAYLMFKVLGMIADPMESGLDLKVNSVTINNAILNIEGLKGVVMETYGSGNASQSQWFTDELQKAVNKGIIIMDVTQCKGGGSVNIGKYESSLHLGKLGIVSGYDIITETAITKMMHLFGTETDNGKIKYLLSKSLRGEMTVE